MSESKIEINQRKIRNGIRKQKEREQRAMWDKLARVEPERSMIQMKVVKQAIRAKSRKLRATWTIEDDMGEFSISKDD